MNKIGSKEKEAELKKKERLKQISKGAIPIEFKFLTIEEIKEQDTMLVEEIKKVAPRDLYAFSKIEKVLYPGNSSTDGFLAHGEKLYDVYEKDKETLKRLGVTYDQVSDKLEEIMQFCKDSKKWGEKIEFGNLSIIICCYCGYQNCPFGCTEELKELGKKYDDPILQKTVSSIDYIIDNKKLGERLILSSLHPHLIRDHHFFEGNTEYRLDPEKTIRVLEIK